ncbi:hypothetical protein LNKW23_45230 [Paralimibaculum aggregatum]|uniref:DUF2160 domain-containing protein n=1 Tax=Paralimibaculum aggregatum TaxID=3036245 RepID=A0ABQ6LTB3_9RHOB|nr:DUF2160 domain-containing protein [Limibaculum sp. NKW23]GMG85304.1 hypothetical protein LNKW23_45230 [Limibaculum sp. NKW23]
MRVSRAIGGALAFGVALAAAAGAARLLAPAEWLAAIGIAAAPEKPKTGGWGAAKPAAPAEPEAVPLIDFSVFDWMAWTPQTGAFFLVILAALAVMTGIEVLAPGGAPRQGALGLETTRGDRLFITLLGSAWILLAWLGLMGAPVWGGLAVALAWGVFVFWKA